jgi:transposase
MTAPAANSSDPRDAEVAVLRATVAELLGVVADLRRTVEAQQAHIHKLVKLTFGARGERVVGPTLFDAVPPADPGTIPPPPGDAPASPPASPRTGHGRRRPPADLPRERIVLDLTDAEKVCPCCSTPRVRVGQDVSERLDYRPASLFVRELVRPTYVCRSCERAALAPQFRQAPLPAEVVPRGGVGPGLLAHAVVAKFCDHLPLNRQTAILAREGWAVPRSTLCDHLRACGRLLEPLYQLMIGRVKTSHAIHADETPVTVLRPRRAAYAWVYLGDAANPYTVFDLTPGRRQEYPEAFLAGYGGFVHADAYAGYNRVHAGARHVGCWMHARRKFVEARDSDPVKAAEALAFVRTLYAVERDVETAGLTGDAVADSRRTRASPILDRFADWLEAEARTARPKSPLGQAVLYARNGWASLTRYVTDGRLAIDNGPAERAVRPLAVGRRNWLFVGGDGGLRTAAVLLSVCASAKRHGVNAWSYLRDLFERLPAAPAGADLSAFLPDAWAKTRLDP